jgi:hypothetical protein
MNKYDVAVSLQCCFCMIRFFVLVILVYDFILVVVLLLMTYNAVLTKSWIGLCMTRPATSATFSFFLR